MKIVTICAATMNTLIVLVCSVLAIANCKDDSVIIIGPKYIQPRQPYTVAMINPFRTEVMMNLTLACDGTASRQTKTLKKESCGRYFLDVPDGIDIKSECAFLADNIGGKIMVKHYVEVRVATKTLSIFIITDKPIYKPGDIVRFRVIVLDMATKPVNHINSIQIDLEDSEKKSQKQWTRAVLNKGIFATEYRLSSTLALGTWNITATVNDGTIPNVQFQLFEVREYVMPKFFIKVTLLRVPLISDKEISLMVEANYTFGRPVRGNILVQLITDDLLNTVADIDEKSFDGNATFRLKLKKELTILDDEDYAMVKAKICLKEQFSDFKLNVTKEIPVFVYPYKITFIGPVKYYRPGVPYHCKLSVKDHNGVPVKDKFIIAKTDTGKKQSATLDSQGIASLDLPMPDTTSSVDISVDFENREYNNVARIEGKKDAPTQHLQISLHKRNIRRSTVSFIVKSNDKFSRLYYFVTSRGNILLARYEQCLNKMKYTINLELTVEMTVQSKLLVYTLNSGQLIMDHFELDYFANGFEFSLQNHTVQPDQNVKINVKAAEDSYVAFQAIDQGALLLGHEVFGITMADVLEDLDAYTPKQNSLNLDPIDVISYHRQTDVAWNIQLCS